MRITEIACLTVTSIVEDLRVRLSHREAKSGAHLYKVNARQVRRGGRDCTEIALEEVLRIILEDRIRELPFEQRAIARLEWKDARAEQLQQHAAVQALEAAEQAAKEAELMELVERLDRERANATSDQKIIPFPVSKIVGSVREVSTPSFNKEVTGGDQKADEGDSEGNLRMRLKALLEETTPDPGHRRQLMTLFLENPEIAEMALSQDTTVRFCLSPTLHRLRCCGILRQPTKTAHRQVSLVANDV